MELPEARRYRKGGMDHLYVTDSEGVTLGWAETMTGEVHVQVPGSHDRIQRAFETWAALYPDDDLATHVPGRHTASLAAAWDAEIAEIDDELNQLAVLRDAAVYQRDQYRKGRSGEARVGAELNKHHAAGWGILHSIPVFGGSADIDHLLIGPGGVWSVNSKSHSAAQIRVDGDRLVVGRVRVDYIPKARSEAAGVQRLLRRAGVYVAVRPLLVFDGPASTTIRVVNPPEGVEISRIQNVAAGLRVLTGALNQEQINAAFAAARLPATWDVNPDW